MPTFEVTSPDGSKYRIDGPEGSTPEQALARLRAQLQPREASFGEKFLMGEGDPVRGVAEIAGQFMPKGEAKATTPVTPDATGAKPKDIQIGTAPVSPTDPARLAGNILNPANLITPLAAGRVPGLAASPMAKTVLSSTVASLLQPVGETDDFLTEKGKQAGTGMVLGYGLSVAGKGVSKGVDALGRWLVSRYPENIMSHAVSLVLKRIEQDRSAGGLTARNMIDLIRNASAEDRPMTLSDVGGKNVERLAGNVYRRGGEGAARADQLFDSRDQAAANRLRQNIAQYIHGGMTVFEATEALLTARSAAARPLYEHTDSLQGIWSPRLDAFFKDPVIKQGMARGYELERLVSLAENRAFNPTAMGVDISDPNNVVFLRTPNMRVLDMAKQGLDAMIADERNEITGRLSARGVALDKLRRGYLAEIDSLDKTGVYRKARQSWAGYSASLDALKAGRAVFGDSPEANAAMVREFAPGSGDIEFYRMGVADRLNEKIAKTGFSGDEAKALINNDWMRRQLKPAFKSDADFDAFVESVAQESRMFSRRRAITGGSQTAERQAEDASPLIAHAERGAEIASNLTKGNPLKAVMNFYRMYKDVGLLPDNKLNEATAKILFSPLVPYAKTEEAKAIRSLLSPPPRGQGNYLAGPARAVQDTIMPLIGAESGEVSGGRPMPLPRYAEGGVSSGGQAVVGEEGPEVVNLPPGAEVVPNIDTLLRMMGSGPVPTRATDEMSPAMANLPGRIWRGGRQAQPAGFPPYVQTTDELIQSAIQSAPMLVPGVGGMVERGVAAAPKVATALLGAGGLLKSTGAAGEQPADFDPEPKRPADIQKTIDDINKKVEPKRKQLDQLGRSLAAGRIDRKEYDQRRVGPEDEIKRADADIAKVDAPFQADFKAWQKRKDDALAARQLAEQKRRERLAEAELPFRIKHPDATSAIVGGGQALSGGTALLAGLLSRGKYMPALASMGLGGLEGAITSNIPEWIDLAGGQPVGSEAWKKTRDQQLSIDNLIKSLSEGGVHAAEAGAIAVPATQVPKVIKRIGEWPAKLREFFSSAKARAPSSPGPATPPQSQTPGLPGTSPSPTGSPPTAPGATGSPQSAPTSASGRPPTMVRNGITYEFTNSGWRVQAGQKGGGRFMKNPPQWPSWLPREDK